MQFDVSLLSKKTFQVTQEDIENGVGNNPYHCPIAQSFDRLDLKCEHGEKIVVYVQIPYIDFCFDNCSVCSDTLEEYQSLRISDRASYKVDKYDRTGIMEPFGFKLRLPNQEFI